MLNPPHSHQPPREIVGSAHVSRILSTQIKQRDESEGMLESLSTTVFYDSGEECTTLDCGPKHFRDGFLFEYSLLLSFDRQADIDCTALGREYFHSEAALRQINLARVRVIQLDGRGRTSYLDCERG